MRNKIFKKALILSAFFVSGLVHAQRCPEALAQGESVNVRYVYDGDTVQLSSRSRVRLVGINTPEMDAGREAERALAIQARQRLIDWLALRKNQVVLVLAQEPKDGFGRQLGYLVDRKDAHQDAAAALVTQGLAHVVAIGANTERLDCYRQLESASRAQRQGVWAWSTRKAASVRDDGFALLKGRITRQTRLKTTTVLVLDDHLVVLLRGALRERSFFVGEYLEVRGWVRNKGFVLGKSRWSWQLSVDHSFAVQQIGVN